MGKLQLFKIGEDADEESTLTQKVINLAEWTATSTLW